MGFTFTTRCFVSKLQCFCLKSQIQAKFALRGMSEMFESKTKLDH